MRIDARTSLHNAKQQGTRRDASSLHGIKYAIPAPSDDDDDDEEEEEEEGGDARREERPAAPFVPSLLLNGKRRGAGNPISPPIRLSALAPLCLARCTFTRSQFA